MGLEGNFVFYLLGDAVGVVLGVQCECVAGALGGEGVANGELDDTAGQGTSFAEPGDRQMRGMCGWRYRVEWTDFRVHGWDRVRVTFGGGRRTSPDRRAVETEVVMRLQPSCYSHSGAA